MQPEGREWLAAQGSKDYRVGTNLYSREAPLGPYLVGINSTGATHRRWPEGQTDEMTVPEGDLEHVKSEEAVTGETVTVEPRSAIMLNVGR